MLGAMLSTVDLILDERTPVGAIANALDDMDHEERWQTLSRLDRKGQRSLYEKAADSTTIELTHFVGEGDHARTEVIHEGRNTLPLPAPLRRFQKRFCRPAGASERLFGYNEGPTRKLVGPGYFVAVRTEGRPCWQARGGVVIDYFQVPEGEVAPGWPAVVANETGLQRFVYAGTRDFMRRVSAQVSIGAAYKGDKPLDHYFVLCRVREPTNR